MPFYQRSTTTSPFSTGSVQTDIEVECTRILKWIKGPGQKLLDSQTTIPSNFEEADELRKLHERFEFKCTESIGSYAHLAELPHHAKVSSSYPTLANELQYFLQKLQYRRNVVVSCVTYFRLLKELQAKIRRLEHLLEPDTVDQEEVTINCERADEKLRHLEELLSDLSTKKESVRNERQRLRLLLGEHLPPALEQAIRETWSHITTLEEKCSLQQLKWRKESRIGRCKKEAENSISWLAGLELVLQCSYRDFGVGKTPVETAALIQEMMELHNKAEEAFEFSARLAQTLRQMFQNDRQLLIVADHLESELHSVWRQYGLLWQELKERRVMADTIYKEVDLLLSRVESLLLTLAKTMNGDEESGISLLHISQATSSRRSSSDSSSTHGSQFDKHKVFVEWVQEHVQEREEIIHGYEKIAQLATTLMQRLNVTLDERSDQELNRIPSLESARAILRMKLYTLWIKITELDDYLGSRATPKKCSDQKESLPQQSVTFSNDIRVGCDKMIEKMLLYESNWKQIKLPCNISQCTLAIHRLEHCREDVEKQWKNIQASVGPHVDNVVQEPLGKCSSVYVPWSEAWKKQSSRLQERHAILSRIEEWIMEVQAPRSSALRHSLNGIKWNERSDVFIWNAQVMKRIEEIPILCKQLEELFYQVHESDLRLSEEGLSEEEMLQNHAIVVDIQYQWSSYLRTLRLLSHILDDAMKLHCEILPKLCPFKSEWIQRYQECQNNELNEECWKQLAADSQRMNVLWASIDQVALQQAVKDLYQSECRIQGLLECLNEYPFNGCPEMQEILNRVPRASSPSDDIQLKENSGLHTSPHRRNSETSPPVVMESELRLSPNLASQQCKEGRPACFRIALPSDNNSLATDRRCYWYKDNQLITPTTHPNCKITVSPDSTQLFITETSREDAGIYHVVAESAKGSIRSEATLDIQSQDEISSTKFDFTSPPDLQSTAQNSCLLASPPGPLRCPPEFFKVFNDTICSPGERVHFMGEIVCSPEPMFWWSYNGRLLSEQSPDGGYEMHQESVHTINEKFTILRCSLIVLSASDTTAGRYSLTVENSLGVATCSALLVVGDSRLPSDRVDGLVSLDSPNESLSKRRTGTTLEFLSFSDERDEFWSFPSVSSANDNVLSPISPVKGNPLRSSRPPKLSESEDKSVNFDSPISTAESHVCCPCDHDNKELVMFVQHEDFQSKRFSFAESSEYESEPETSRR